MVGDCIVSALQRDAVASRAEYKYYTLQPDRAGYVSTITTGHTTAGVRTAPTWARGQDGILRGDTSSGAQGERGPGAAGEGPATDSRFLRLSGKHSVKGLDVEEKLRVAKWIA